MTFWPPNSTGRIKIAARNIDRIIKCTVEPVCVAFIPFPEFTAATGIVKFLHCGLTENDLLSVKVKVCAFTPSDPAFRSVSAFY